MNYLVAHLSDDYLLEIADYFANRNPAPDHVTPPPLTIEQSARAKALISDGVRSRALPACAACHGERLMGRDPDVPALIGLYPDYIRAQLGAWKIGARSTLAPDCMGAIARKLTDPEIAELSNWLAAQPVPTDTSRAPPQRLAEACVPVGIAP